MCNFQGTIEWVRQSTKTHWKFIFISVFALTGIGIYAVSEGTLFLSFTHSLLKTLKNLFLSFPVCFYSLRSLHFRLEITRFELVTPCLQGRCSPNWAIPPYKVSLMFYLNFIIFNGMGLSGLEPPTSRLSGVRSNRLSYKPIWFGSHLLSHAVSSIVSSAARVLTIVFGMRTGVSPKRIATKRLCYSILQLITQQ